MVERSEVRKRRSWARAGFALAILASVVLLLVDRPDNRPPLLDEIRTWTGDAAAPIMGAVAAPIRGIRSIFDGIGDYWNAVGENRQLRKEVAELRQWRNLALSLRDKVESYESILEIPRVQAADPIGAWSVTDSGGPFVQARLIDAGWRRGVREGHPVLNERGLVGRVVNVGQSSARVLLLTDLNSRIPVMTEEGEARALLIGDNSTAPRLEFVNRGAVLEEGERIVTSGDGGLLPRGLPVGVAAPASGVAWRVRLYSAGQPIDMIWVYPFTPLPQPVSEPITEEQRADDAERVAQAQEEAQTELAAITAPTPADTTITIQTGIGDESAVAPAVDGESEPEPVRQASMTATDTTLSSPDTSPAESESAARPQEAEDEQEAPDNMPAAVFIDLGDEDDGEAAGE